MNGVLLLIAVITIVGPPHPRVPYWQIQTTTDLILLAESGDARTHIHRGLSVPHPFVYIREHVSPQILVSGGCARTNSLWILRTTVFASWCIIHLPHPCIRLRRAATLLYSLLSPSL